MTKTIPEILAGETFARDDVIALLSTTDPADAEAIRTAAHRVLVDNCGTSVFLRGLVEFSNRCASDCHYCGIRKGNAGVKRYCLTKDEIVDAARFCAEAGYGSMVLQSGERRDERFVSFVEDVVCAIKKETVSNTLPRGLGITLSVGEQTPEAYKRFFNAGAHRYLLRIETSSPRLFASIHPSRQSFEARLACLAFLKDAGFQVGTGVMIGLPGQTVQDLADDVLFFRAIDADMIGMGPFIVHRQTPMARHDEAMAARKKETLELALRMIAVTRLVCRDVNIASATALQAMEPLGREMGLLHGANVVMPQATPARVRRDYQLYEGKPCLDENAQECRECLCGRIRSLGREPATGQWGDPKHFDARQRHAAAQQ
jgi:biotin synthase